MNNFEREIKTFGTMLFIGSAVLVGTIIDMAKINTERNGELLTISLLVMGLALMGLGYVLTRGSGNINRT